MLKIKCMAMSFVNQIAILIKKNLEHENCTCNPYMLASSSATTASLMDPSTAPS
jgi:hypothetical protein